MIDKFGENPFEEEPTDPQPKLPEEETTGDGFSLASHVSDSFFVPVEGTDTPLLIRIFEAEDGSFELKLSNVSLETLQQLCGDDILLSEQPEFTKLERFKPCTVNVEITVLGQSGGRCSKKIPFSLGTDDFLNKVFEEACSLLKDSRNEASCDLQILLSINPQISSEEITALEFEVGEEAFHIRGVTTQKIRDLLGVTLGKTSLGISGLDGWIDSARKPSKISLEVSGAARSMLHTVVLAPGDTPETFMSKVVKAVHTVIGGRGHFNDTWDITLTK
jgi:hypothetical protein